MSQSSETTQPDCSELITMAQLYRMLCEQPWPSRRRMVDWLHDRIEQDRAEMKNGN